MGLFDDALSGSGNQPAKVTKEHAFLGLLMLADYSDGNVTEEEVRSFANTICRMKMYRDLSETQLNRLIDQALGFIKRLGMEESMAKFCAALPESLHRAIFANACNQVLADGVVEEEEKQFLNDLRKALGLAGDDAQMIAKVMVWKNQG